mmetsp:Transcript_24041/g.58159  ORF Transcript_24041/g.58159 Transcript_24041/m.58159 type:complete len:231 (-) Transcript_24041:299-991(-)
MLQARPRYLAKISRCINARDAHKFVRIVVFEIFGDQHDPREERLLFECFGIIFKDRMAAQAAKGTGMNSLFRSNIPVTRSLTAYANRGQGLLVLKRILKDPLMKILDFKESLELNPRRSSMNSMEDGIRNHKRMRRFKKLKHRLGSLATYCEEILKRNPKIFPYGIRWLSRTLVGTAKEAFSDATREQLDVLVGGVIYLRYLNPVIVNPSMVFVCKDISSVARRNLNLVA